MVFEAGDHTFGGSHPYAENFLPEPLLSFCKQAILFLKIRHPFVCIIVSLTLSTANTIYGHQGFKEKREEIFKPDTTGEVKLGDVIPMMKAYATNKAEVVPKNALGPFKTDSFIYRTPPESGLRITWIGHSSLLIEIGGIRILTDPVWSDRASFTTFAGPKRFFKPPLPLEELPPIDAVIISHDHYDHLDKKTIQHFAGTTIPFYCSLGVKTYLKDWGIVSNYVSELDWGDSVMIGDCILTAAPARHFSGRA